MVNLAVALKSSMCMIVKSAGIVPYTVEIEPGTNIHFSLPKKSDNKPAVLLIHGFAGDGVMTWALQVRSLSKRYSVYIPDLLFFGKSYTDKPDRSPKFQAECLVKAMRILGVKTFVPVGFSYGGVVAFKIAELHGDMVKALVVSGSPPVMTDSNVNQFGYSSISEVLLPKTVKGLKFLLSAAMHKRIWLPNWPLKDYLKVHPLFYFLFRKFFYNQISFYISMFKLINYGIASYQQPHIYM